MTVEEDEALAAVPGSSVAEDRDRRRLDPARGRGVDRDLHPVWLFARENRGGVDDDHVRLARKKAATAKACDTSPLRGSGYLVGRGDDSDQKISSHATYTAAKKPSLTVPSQFQSHTNVQPFSALGRLIRNRGQETLRRPGRRTDRGLS